MRIAHPHKHITSIGTPDGEIGPDPDGYFTVPDEVGAHLVEFGWAATGDYIAPEADGNDDTADAPEDPRDAEIAALREQLAAVAEAGQDDGGLDVLKAAAEDAKPARKPRAAKAEPAEPVE